MLNRREIVPFKRSYHGVDVVRHHTPRGQVVSLPIKVEECALDQCRDLWVAQVARALSGIQVGLDLFGVQSDEARVLLVCQLSSHGLGTSDDLLTFSAPSGRDLLRNRVR